MKRYIFISVIIASLLCVGLAKEKQFQAHDHSHDHDNEHPHSHQHSHSSPKKNTVLIESSSIGGVWSWSFAATCLIGLAPIVILEFVPLVQEVKDKQVVNHDLLKTLLGFAVGGLLGDVFLHLLPHSQASSGDGHSHSHSNADDETSIPHDHSASLTQGLWILAGILVFFLMEKYLRIKNASGDSKEHSHSHSHGHKEEKKESKNKESKDETEKERKEKEKEKKANFSAILNIIADAAHNFTDGMAIAGSFMLSYKVGISTTVAVFIHEIPHEIGDYAILIQNGFTKKQAMKMQVLTAIGALIGTLFGLITGGLFESMVSSVILPFTAGGFIYVALVGVIPELLEGSNFWQTVKEVLAMCTGVGLMVFIAQIE